MSSLPEERDAVDVEGVPFAEGVELPPPLSEAEERLLARKSAPRPDKPDSRTKSRKPAALSEKSVRKAEPDNTGSTPALALEKDILGRFRADLRNAGVAGEERLAQLVYLALTSRVLPWGRSTERPVSVLAKGTTSTGKSLTTQTVLRFLPREAYIDLGSMSRRFLFYDEETYSHRFLIVLEWASIAEDDELVALLRTLLSEGRIMHGTVEGEGKRSARRIQKEGPTGLIVTTTEGVVDAEMETRCLSLTTDDTPEQTRRVFAVFADQEEELAAVDFTPWHELQSWIGAHGETRVLVPFVRALSELMPAGATRLRRDFVSLLCLVRAHAILYQAQRERDPSGRIIATVEGDYGPIRTLVGELIAEGVEASIPARTRETVEAVRDLIDAGTIHPSPKSISDHLGIGRSATYDRIRDSLRRGFLVNEADRTERGYKLTLGAELPAGETDFLPAPEELVRPFPDGRSGQSLGSTTGPRGPSSGCPARSEDPQDGAPLLGDRQVDLPPDAPEWERAWWERQVASK
jgi:hypothetical protein